ncbi:unnamed protein product [Vitrella brassicaformis CCMP3155]|uniref:Uncharacterized protein n=2 Tax=Vitrella brassicaformis TaxID=1169539 RepID=A0A0G4EER3_VITBC|nr:unnamed protein product [Vitrella brassicaformis CCMP3155]|eukprot:CEL94496.1 unnamed protein product [Vitrella brassicaformis CCMP3155]
MESSPPGENGDSTGKSTSTSAAKKKTVRTTLPPIAKAAQPPDQPQADVEAQQGLAMEGANPVVPSPLKDNADRDVRPRQQSSPLPGAVPPESADAVAAGRRARKESVTPTGADDPKGGGASVRFSEVMMKQYTMNKQGAGGEAAGGGDMSPVPPGGSIPKGPSAPAQMSRGSSPKGRTGSLSQASQGSLSVGSKSRGTTFQNRTQTLKSERSDRRYSDYEDEDGEPPSPLSKGSSAWGESVICLKDIMDAVWVPEDYKAKESIVKAVGFQALGFVGPIKEARVPLTICALYAPKFFDTLPLLLLLLITVIFIYMEGWNTARKKLHYYRLMPKEVVIDFTKPQIIREYRLVWVILTSVFLFVFDDITVWTRGTEKEKLIYVQLHLGYLAALILSTYQAVEFERFLISFNKLLEHDDVYREVRNGWSDLIRVPEEVYIKYIRVRMKQLRECLRDTLKEYPDQTIDRTNPSWVYSRADIIYFIENELGEADLEKVEASTWEYLLYQVKDVAFGFWLVSANLRGEKATRDRMVARRSRLQRLKTGVSGGLVRAKTAINPPSSKSSRRVTQYPASQVGKRNSLQGASERQIGGDEKPAGFSQLRQKTLVLAPSRAKREEEDSSPGPPRGDAKTPGRARFADSTGKPETLTFASSRKSTAKDKDASKRRISNASEGAAAEADDRRKLSVSGVSAKSGMMSSEDEEDIEKGMRQTARRSSVTPKPVGVSKVLPRPQEKDQTLPPVQAAKAPPPLLAPVAKAKPGGPPAASPSG